MAEETHSSEAKSKVAQERERDAQGHFIREAGEAAKAAISDVKENIHYDKHLGGILDIHVRDPLERIGQLLEELKRQKAFAFTLKGSLGVAGVAVALSVFGFFGGSKILCDKGTQTEIGLILILNATEPESSNVPLLGFVINFLRGTLNTQTTHNRIILETKTDSTISLPYTGKINFEQYKNKEVFVTGSYDNCSRILKTESIELLRG